MSTRRDFLKGSATVMGAAVSPALMAQIAPCAPQLLNPQTLQSTCVLNNAPQYISSMAPFQVRSMSGAYSPSNGTSTLRSVMPAMWSGNDDIMRPWSGGAKSMTGTRVWVHGGGHSDSNNNAIAYFDFAGTDRPTGWVMASGGQTGINGIHGTAIGARGYPVSVHTYDGMCELNGAVYRFGGSPYPNGGFSDETWRFDPGPAEWTRLPNYPGYAFAGMVIANAAANKILALERWVTYYTYAFYRAGTNSWGTLRQVGSQFPNDSVVALNTRTNTALYSSSGIGFTSVVDWNAETITQTSASIQSFPGGSAAVYDPTADRYWMWGGTGNAATIYEIHPTTLAVTSHALTGDVPLGFESGDHGTWGRFVFIDGWRAIGSVANRGSAAYIIRLP